MDGDAASMAEPSESAESSDSAESGESTVESGGAGPATVAAFGGARADATSVQDSSAKASSVKVTSPKARRRRVIALIALLPVLIAFVAVAGWYATTRKPLTTLPGLSQEVPHYAFSIYGVTNPLGVAVTPSGDRIYVTESNGDRVVRVYDRSGKALGALKPPASTGGAHVPVYVAINPKDGNVYVSDRATASVYVYGVSGDYLRTFTPQGDLGGGWAPLGLAFDQSGRLYVTDVRGDRHRVLVFGTDGALQRSLGGPGQLSFPNGLVIDGSGNVDVSDSNNGRLVVFGADGAIVATISRGVGEGDLGLPRGTAIDDHGRLYVVDTSNHTVRMYRTGDRAAPTPRYVGSFGEEGTLDGRFEFPNGIATDNRARVYITDRENNRIQVWSY